MLGILFGMAALVLVIACANVASLLLARSIARGREIAIRTAVGATRWRIVRQLLIECLVLATLAGTLGAVLSRYGARFLVTGFDLIEPGMPNVRPYWVDLSMDSSAYLFVAAVCLLTTLAFGLDRRSTPPATAPTPFSRMVAATVRHVPHGGRAYRSPGKSR